MKLRNKKNGEILEVITDSISLKVLTDGEVITGYYSSLAELNAEWEDYEEPKDYWYIDCDGEVYSTDRLNVFDLDRMMNIGNRFNSREEAEKAVEKLKSWKRLKDAGYYFKSDAIEEGLKHYYILRLECEQEKIMKSVAECKSNYRDLKILFGGE